MVTMMMMMMRGGKGERGEGGGRGGGREGGGEGEYFAYSLTCKVGASSTCGLSGHLTMAPQLWQNLASHLLAAEQAWHERRTSASSGYRQHKH